MADWKSVVVDSRYRTEKVLASSAAFGDLVAGELLDGRDVVILRLSPLLASFIGHEQAKLRAQLFQQEGLPMLPLLDVFASGEGTHMVYERLDGAEPLYDYLHAKTLTETIQVLQNVCVAIEELHQRTMWHGGIVPEYVWVLPDGSVRLMTMPTDSPLVLYNAAGNGPALQFFAPETLTMSPIDARTDIYNLGVLFYVMLTGGTFPFGEQAEDSLYPPSTFNSHIPPHLDRLVLKMINSRPTRRFQRVGQVIDELSRMLGTHQTREAFDRQTFGAQHLFSPEFIGRQEEVARLSQFYERVYNGSTSRRSVLLTGGQGVGRRRLIYEVSGRYMYQVSGLSVVVREMPFSAVEGLAMKLIMLCNVVQKLERLGRFYANRLARVLPRVAYEFPDLISDSREQDVVEKVESESLLFEFFTEIIAAYDEPISFELYEAHLLDSDSIQFFQKLMAKDSLRIGLIGVADELTPGLHALFQEHMPLQPLPPVQMREVVLSRFGDADFLTDEFIEWLNYHSGGSLGSIFKMLEYLADTQQIYLQRYGWHMVPTSVEKLNIPQSMESLILYRLEHLPAGAKAVIQAVSLFKGVFLYEAVAKVVGMESVQEVLQVMHRLEEQGLLLQGHTHYRFPSHNVKVHVNQSIPEAEKKELHRKLASALLEVGSREFMEIAHHFEQGEQWEWAIYLYIAGARRCYLHNLLADSEAQIRKAIELYRHLPNRECPISLAKFRAKLLRKTGSLEEAAHVYRDVYECSGSESTLASLLMVYVNLGNFQAIKGYVEYAEGLVADEHRVTMKTRTALMVVLGMYYIEQGDYSYIQEMERFQDEHGAMLREQLHIRQYVSWLYNLAVLLTNVPGLLWEQRSRYLQEAATLAEHYEMRGHLVGIYNLMAIGFQESEPLKAKDYYLLSAKLASEVGDKSNEATAYINLVEVYRLLGDMYHSHRYIEKARETNLAVNNAEDRHLLQHEIEYFLFIEEYAKAQKVIQQLARSSKQSGQQKLRDYAFMYQFRSYVEQGNRKRCERMWAIVERICETRQFMMEYQFLWAKYNILCGHYDVVIEELSRLINDTTAPAVDRIKCHIYLIEALMKVGRWHEGLEIAQAAQKLIHNTGCVGFLAKAHFYLGRLYQLTHQFVQANLNYKRALMWYRKLNQQSRLVEIDRLMRQTNQEMVKNADVIIDRMKDVKEGQPVPQKLLQGGAQLKDWARSLVKERQEMIDTLTDNEILLDAIRRVSSSIMIKTVCENVAAVVFENLLFDHIHLHIKVSEERFEKIHLNEQLQELEWVSEELEAMIGQVCQAERPLEQEGRGSYLYGLPVFSHDQQVIAVMVLEKMSLQTPFTVRDKRFITSFAQLVSSNVENAIMYEVMITDHLTGLYQRNYFMKRLHEEFAKIARYGIDLSFLMIDLDNFSIINNLYGHNEGDRVLRTVAQTLLKSVRNVDIVGRFGGEEMIVILPNTNGMAARIVAERILQNLRNIPVQDNRYQITASIGVASHDLDQPIDVIDLIEKADQAETYAKRTGKDRVICHWEMESSPEFS